MHSIEGIDRSFRLMLVQVTKQLENTARLLDAPTPAIINSIYNAEEFIDTQKSQIEKECFTYLGSHEIKDERQVDVVRALNTIASNLERISDFSINIVQQVQHLQNQAALKRFPASRLPRRPARRRPPDCRRAVQPRLDPGPAHLPH